MGNTDGRKGDLFDRIDTASRGGHTDLFDSRKRKVAAAAAASSSDHGYDHYEPGLAPPPAKKLQYHPANTDLGAMLRGDHISRSAYARVQHVIKDQEKKIKDLSKMVNERDESIDRRDDERRMLTWRVESLEAENARNKQVATANGATLKQLRDKKDTLEKRVKEKDDFIAMGTVAVKEKTSAAKQVEAENVRLRQTVTERDLMITKLNEQIWKVTSAPEESRAHHMLQAQASTTLGMVNGLKADVQCRDELIRDLEGQVANLTAAVKAGGKVKSDLQREVEGVKRELKTQTQVAENAAKRATDARLLAEQQEGLIKRILEENKRLGRDEEV